MSSHKVISLDFWETLAVFNPKFAKARTAYLADLFGLSDDLADARYRRIKSKCDYEAQYFGASTTPISAAKMLLEGMTLTRDSNAVEVAQDMANLAREYPPLLGDGIADMLERVRNYGFGLTLSSNTNFIGGSTLRELFLTSGKLPISLATFSDEIGVSKPDANFFHCVRKRALEIFPKVPVWNITHIGDNPVCDVSGAQSLGMEAILTTSTKHTRDILDSFCKSRIFA